jgi:hypothetical protein
LTERDYLEGLIGAVDGNVRYAPIAIKFRIAPK